MIVDFKDISHILMFYPQTLKSDVSLVLCPQLIHFFFFPCIDLLNSLEYITLSIFLFNIKPSHDISIEKNNFDIFLILWIYLYHV